MATAISDSTFRVTWTNPECPYGVINRYIVFYRISDTVQTPPISSDGYSLLTYDFDLNADTTMRYSQDISNLPPYTNYSIHVQAVIRRDGQEALLGRVQEEVLVQTSSEITISILLAFIHATGGRKSPRPT